MKTNQKAGLYSSIALTTLTVIAFGFAMIAIPPAGPYCPGDCMTYPYLDELLSYYPRDYIWMVLTCIQLCAFLIFIIANHFNTTNEKQFFSFVSIAFALISVTVLMGDYFIQFSVIPTSMMKGQTEGVSMLTQYNGNGIFIALEELGYILMSISFLFLAPVFSWKSRLEKAIRATLIIPFVVTVAAFLYYHIAYGIETDYLFEVATITINWLTTIVVGILTAFFYKNKMSSIN